MNHKQGEIASFLTLKRINCVGPNPVFFISCSHKSIPPVCYKYIDISKSLNMTRLIIELENFLSPYLKQQSKNKIKIKKH